MTARRRLHADRLARWLVTAGGLGIIAAVLGIFLFILVEVRPLFSRARVSPGAGAAAPVVPAAALLGDEHRIYAAALGLDGVIRFFRLADGLEVMRRPVLEAAGGPSLPLAGAMTVPGQPVFAASTMDGRVIVVPIAWTTRFEAQDRIVSPHVGEPVVLVMDPGGSPVRVLAARADGRGGAAAAAQIEDGDVVLVRREIEENAITGEKKESITRSTAGSARPLTALLLDQDLTNMYAATDRGDLIWWRIRNGVPMDPQEISAGASPITALSLLIGDRTLVVGQADGSLSLWFQVRREGETTHLRRIRDFPRHPGAVREIAPSLRGKGFIAACESGRVGLYYSTSGRTLWTGESPVGAPTAVFFTPKGDGALLAGRSEIRSLDVEIPHPEVGLGALFGKVWYEGYDEPEYVWQSSGGTDDYEPKLSLVPLLFGTLKGTFYSLILAIPLAVLGAMYTSQFMHPDLKRFVKPTVEIMAALPSVVLGFLAGLWLAPRMERLFPAFILMAVLLPVTILVTGFLWRALPPRRTGPLPAGGEVILFVAVLALGIGLCVGMSRPFENLVFDGSFQTWLRQTFSLPYDQRNAVVVGLAMGFAVIPIIFAISEDAFSNVPASLSAGSLALGATRWQTVTRVVLPTASPGIFSAIMVGFGRAVGETMIVVMATGNTPILDWNPFNGFRTLSANIAVEIPEAPYGGTLYRTLFLAALLLFLFTFAANTAAELVRQRLRRRYAEL